GSLPPRWGIMVPLNVQMPNQDGWLLNPPSNEPHSLGFFPPQDDLPPPPGAAAPCA
ncbi:hypothetical protein KI387_012578, partial [Taxus chinensis]